MLCKKIFFIAHLRFRFCCSCLLNFHSWWLPNWQNTWSREKRIFRSFLISHNFHQSAYVSERMKRLFPSFGFSFFSNLISDNRELLANIYRKNLFLEIQFNSSFVSGFLSQLNFLNRWCKNWKMSISIFLVFHIQPEWHWTSPTLDIRDLYFEIFVPTSHKVMMPRPLRPGYIAVRNFYVYTIRMYVRFKYACDIDWEHLLIPLRHRHVVCCCRGLRWSWIECVHMKSKFIYSTVDLERLVLEKRTLFSFPILSLKTTARELKIDLHIK